MAMERGLLRPLQRPSLTTPTDTPPTATMAMERGLLILNQPQRPSLTTPTDTPPTATMAMERGPLMLRQIPRPMPGMDMVACMATDTQSTAIVMVFMESGLLKPSQRPSLTTPTDTLRTAIMAMERGPLMLSQRQRPSHTTPTDTPPMATMATERGLQRPHQRPSLTTPMAMDILLMDTTGVKFY